MFTNLTLKTPERRHDVILVFLLLNNVSIVAFEQISWVYLLLAVFMLRLL